ncbi:MAG: rhodanese-like domain-containing protein [Desulfuromonadaceae bacterium]
MKLGLLMLALVLITPPSAICAAESEFDIFLNNFNYDVRDEMKIDSKELLPLLTNGKAVLVDVRFVEEVEAWKFSYARNIPLNEFPARIQELPKDKIIVAACPHKDRSAIAMTYLRTKGYNAKYLTDGLIGLAEYLRGERAKDFVEDMAKLKQKKMN